MRLHNPSGLGVLGLLAFALCKAALAAPLAGNELLAALQRGGYVFVVRHASSPATPPDAAQADPENVRHERQLDEVGQRSARSMGEAFRRLRIPVGEVLSSPTYRALEMARLARLGSVQALTELGDAGKSMSSDASGARGRWLRSTTAESPRPGTDTVIITHSPNIAEAFPREGKDVADGETLIFHPDGHGGASFVARIKIEAWSSLAKGQ